MREREKEEERGDRKPQHHCDISRGREEGRESRAPLLSVSIVGLPQGSAACRESSTRQEFYLKVVCIPQSLAVDLMCVMSEAANSVNFLAFATIYGFVFTLFFMASLFSLTRVGDYRSLGLYLLNLFTFEPEVGS